MEDYIVYIAVAISIIASIYKNFKKQQAANEKRAIGTPAPKPQATQAKPVPVPTLFQTTKPKAAPKAVQLSMPDKSKSLIEADLEQINKGGRLAPSIEYVSLESTISNYSSLKNSPLFAPMEENFESIGSIDDDDIKDEKPLEVKPHPLFETKDDFRKAIIYNAVFERKYA